MLPQTVLDACKDIGAMHCYLRVRMYVANYLAIVRISRDDQAAMHTHRSELILHNSFNLHNTKENVVIRSTQVATRA